ncbi:hypothetical protein [Acinetobacter johnsonii]|uniref:hypothetical protein n=1 Tax=Acinetobacter johnsonii TaxID=40214 RepID=UPI0032B52B71
MNIKYAEKSIQTERFNTAVLFVVFNRPDTTKQVFEAIRKAKPPRLYVAADGPRLNTPNDIEKIREVRETILQNIDWECEVKTLFREENLSCGIAVKEALDWFFENEEQGIVLEDDTVPSLSFFWYCEELLEKYKHDERIGLISGVNHIGYIPKQSSYVFSKNKACWGWASWRRSWRNMDFNMNWRESIQSEQVMYNMGVSTYHYPQWKKALKAIDEKLVNAWDWQWYFSIAAQNQLTIFPSANLISNIGIGQDATHTFGKPKKEEIERFEINLPLTHPVLVCPEFNFDLLFEQYRMKPRKPRWISTLIKFIPKEVRIIIKKVLFISS